MEGRTNVEINGEKKIASGDIKPASTCFNPIKVCLGGSESWNHVEAHSFQIKTVKLPYEWQLISLKTADFCGNLIFNHSKELSQNSWCKKKPRYKNSVQPSNVN